MSAPRVLVAMSGGVDSSVAAARLVEAGYDVTGVTLKLWGGDADRGCCSVSDVDDARWVARQLDIDHLVFNYGDEFAREVVAPYVAAHAAGRTPNPCIDCNRHLKFDRLLHRAEVLGFDLLATGHHARVVRRADGTCCVARGADRDKDQSYVLHMLRPSQLERIVFPVGDLTKDLVRAEATRLGLATAAKPDSQDVCFITSTGGRTAFLGDRIELHPGRLVDRDGRDVGGVDHVELVTVGQRRGLGPSGAGRPRYALEVDVESATVVVGDADELLVDSIELAAPCWLADQAPRSVTAQCSAHGRPRSARVVTLGRERLRVDLAEPARRVAPGQSVVLYDDDQVVGAGTVA